MILSVGQLSLARPLATPQSSRAYSTSLKYQASGLDGQKASRLLEMLKGRGYGNWKVKESDIPDSIVVLADCEANVQKTAAKAFSKMGKNAMKQVASQLDNKDASIRATAADILGMSATAAAEHVNELAKLLKDEDHRVRRSATASFSLLGSAIPETTSHCPQLVKLLKDSNAEVRRLAVEALGKLGDHGKEHIDACAKLLSDSQWTVRRSAVEVLGHMGKTAEPYSEDIAKLMDDKEWIVRGAAADALGRIGSKGCREVRSTAGEMSNLLYDREWWVRNTAAEALYNLGGEGRFNLEIFHEGMRSPAAEELATRFNPPRPQSPDLESNLPPKNLITGRQTKMGKGTLQGGGGGVDQVMELPPQGLKAPRKTVKRGARIPMPTKGSTMNSVSVATFSYLSKS